MADSTLSRAIRDFVQWLVIGGRESQAVAVGQWPEASSVVDTTGLDPGESLARTPGANTEAPADWYVESTPTLGAANDP